MPTCIRPYHRAYDTLAQGLTQALWYPDTGPMTGPVVPCIRACHRAYDTLAQGLRQAL